MFYVIHNQILGWISIRYYILSITYISNMQDLEHFFKNNRQAFDVDVLPEGHFERFANKMAKAQRKSSQKFVVLRYAAALLAFLMIGFVGGYVYQQNQQPQAALGSISPEYMEVETFFQSSVSQKMDQLKKMDCDLSRKAMKDALAEFKKIDLEYADLQKNFSQNADDERVISAMISCYQSKLDILSRMLTQINQKC